MPFKQDIGVGWKVDAVITLSAKRRIDKMATARVHGVVAAVLTTVLSH